MVSATLKVEDMRNNAVDTLKKMPPIHLSEILEEDFQRLIARSLEIFVPYTLPAIYNRS